MFEIVKARKYQITSENGNKNKSNKFYPSLMACVS